MEYGIISTPSTLGNTNSNEILERIHHVLVNLVRTFNRIETYFDEYDSKTDILYAAEFAMLSTTNRLKGYSPGQLLFGCDIIPLGEVY